MRALHELAVVLGTSVAVLVATLSAQEFARWKVWLQAEQVGPRWDALRHAELLAAVHNGGNYQRKGGGAFTRKDFMPADPWQAVPQLTPEQLQAQQEAEFAAFMSCAKRLGLDRLPLRLTNLEARFEPPQAITRPASHASPPRRAVC